MDIEKILHDEIVFELEELKGKEHGTNEYVSTVEGVTKLIDRAIEMDKLNIEHEEKEKQVQRDEKDRLIKNIIAVAGIVLPCIITVWGTCKSFEFEKEGTITTIMGRGFVNKLLPKK